MKRWKQWLVAVSLSLLASSCSFIVPSSVDDVTDEIPILTEDNIEDDSNLDYGIPGKADIVLNRTGFANGYSHSKHQPMWVCYRYTYDKATNSVHRRPKSFFTDTNVCSSATTFDYSRSGYDRGHIAPAGDMAWSRRAQLNCFLMTNISPQVRAFNQGIWNDLENWVRKIVVTEGSIFVFTGPIYATNSVPKTIGKTKIEVPIAYYKVILSEKEPKKAIGFILNNEPSNHNLSHFACTVDEVESVTGFDFFKTLPLEIQEDIESNVNISEWNF